MTRSQAGVRLMLAPEILLLRISGPPDGADYLIASGRVEDGVNWLPVVIGWSRADRGTAPRDSTGAPPEIQGTVEFFVEPGSGWQTPTWRGRAVTVWSGASVNADGSVPHFDDLEEQGQFEIVDATEPDEQGRATLEFTRMGPAEETAFQESVYLARGSGVAMEEAAVARVTSPGAFADIVGPMTLAVHCDDPATTTTGSAGATFLARDPGAAMGYGIVVRSDGHWGFGRGVERVFSDAALPGGRVFLGVSVDAAGVVSLRFAGEDGVLTAVGAGSVTPVDASTGDLVLCGAAVSATLRDVRLFPEAMELEQMRDLTVPRVGAAGALVWRFEERSGSVARSEGTATLDANLTGSFSWVASSDGDDAETWGKPDVSGLLKPRNLGRRHFNARADLIDTPTRAFDVGNVTRFRQFRSGPRPLAPRLAFIVSAAGQMTLSSGQLLLADGFADARTAQVRQDEPALAGQNLEITLPSAEAGTYEVVSVSEDGRTIDLDPAPGDETLPVGVTVKTPDAEWVVDFADPRAIAVREAADANIFVDFESGTGPFSSVLSALLADPVVYDLTLDPYVSIRSPAVPASPTLLDIVSDLVRGAGAVLAPRRRGESHRVRTLRRPLAADATFRIPAAMVASYRESAVEATSEVAVSWGRNHTPAAAGSYEGTSAPLSLVRRLETPVNWERRTLSGSGRPIEWDSHVDNEGDALRLLEILADFYGRSYRQFEIEIAGAIPVRPGDVGILSLPGPAGVDAAPILVLSTERASTGLHALEVQT